MKQVAILVLCVACCLGYNLARRRLEALERELESRLVQREVERDQRGVGQEFFEEELEARDLDEYLNERELRDMQRARRQSSTTPIKNCVVGDIVFVLDSSGSIGIAHWKLVLDFVSSVIDKLNVGPLDTHVGLITYGNRAHLIFNLVNYTDPVKMKAAVAAAPFLDENTNTSGAIWLAQKVVLSNNNGGRAEAPDIMIVITDGVSTYDHQLTIPYAKEAQAAGTMVVALGVGDQTSPDELNGIASLNSSGKPMYWQVGGYDMLTPVLDTLAHVACQVPPDNSTLPNPCNATVVVCPGMACQNKCQYGFAPDTNQCLTCNCLPVPKTCP